MDVVNKVKKKGVWHEYFKDNNHSQYKVSLYGK